MVRVSVCHLRGAPLLTMLHWEEILLRHTSSNWLLLNSRIPFAAPTIVLGFSGKMNELINCDHVARDNIPVIRRFSGGGTVIVDASTIFATIIMNNSDVSTRPYPKEIMAWSENFYAPVFHRANTLQPVHRFRLRENDYIFEEPDGEEVRQFKVGGNAQSIVKDRWIHHTSFLFDFDEKNMDYLLIPKKQPEYRANRQHTRFLTKLRHYMPSVESFESAVVIQAHADFGHLTTADVDVSELQHYVDNVVKEAGPRGGVQYRTKQEVVIPTNSGVVWSPTRSLGSQDIDI